ncbi:GlxA family transcriptional regulator [Massilia sp. TN1-12]|uniref:GlxA family transcriptional regulator n=1 Tax=Massilia paldalensis TaxID=3377675 RepID=UPI003850D23A
MKQIGLLLPPGFQALDFMASTVFEVANTLLDEPCYEVTVLSEHGGMLASSSGIQVLTAPVTRYDYDTLLVAGQMMPGAAPASDGFLDILRRAGQESRRVAALCTGAFLLAQAGLLEGRRATTHWELGRTLQHAFPRLQVDENRIFINAGKFWTSAGMAACVDLCLALVEDDHGTEVSCNVARRMVLYHRRSGGQSQFSSLLELQPKSDRIQKALTYAKRHLRKPLSVDELADAANLSTRQFSRTFRTETGQSPARAIERLRVEAARAMMEDSNHPVDVVARETGFADSERMRRAFVRAFGQPPQAIKRAARAQAEAFAQVS